MNDTYKPRHALVTGANRGLGLEVVRLLAADGVTVFATARQPTGPTWEEFEPLPGSIIPVPLDVTDPDQPVRLARTVAHETGGELDCLINNAGIYLDSGKPVDQLDPEELASTLITNVCGPHRVLLALHPLLARSPDARVVQVSSRRGSIALKFEENVPTDDQGAAYGTSKAALNMLSVAWAARLHESGIRLSLVSPGWCRTSMGGDDANLSATEGARLILQALHEAPGSFTGDREPILW